MLPAGQARTEIIMSAEPVVIKRYANRRLYNPAAGSYVTIKDLGALVEDEADFVVYDASTGDDVTHTVLKQIIVERAREGYVLPTDHHQDIRQPAALQHRHQHRGHARGPRVHGEGGRGFS